MHLRSLAGTAATIVFAAGALASAGVTTTTLVDGSTSTTLIDGSTSTTLVDGSTTTTLIDGSTSTTLIDGSTTTTLVNGSTSTTLVDGSTTTTVIGGSTTSSTLPGGETSAHDALFVLEASLANLGEIESGQFMSDAGQHPDVRAYGAQMVTEHCAHLNNLQDAADAAGIAPPRALDVTPCDDASPNGAFVTPSRDADVTYVRGQITGHRKALDLYKRQARFGTDQGLVSLAESIIPTLKDHLKQAKRLSRAVRRGRGNDGNNTTTTTLPGDGGGPNDDGGGPNDDGGGGPNDRGRGAY